MLLASKISILIVFLSLENSIYGARTILEHKNQMRDKLQQRQKRWLVFPPNGGTGMNTHLLLISILYPYRLSFMLQRNMLVSMDVAYINLVFESKNRAKYSQLDILGR